MSIRPRSESKYGQGCRVLAIGSDHGGYALKKVIVDYIKSKYPEISVQDVGNQGTDDRVDYPDVAAAACRPVQEGLADRAILIDGVGVASGVCANKHNGIRGAVVWDHFSATMARQHSDANVFCLGGQCLGPLLAKEIVDVFVNTKFEGDRHLPRLAKVEAIENSQQSFGASAGGSRASANFSQAGSPYKLPH